MKLLSAVLCINLDAEKNALKEVFTASAWGNGETADVSTDQSSELQAVSAGSLRRKGIFHRSQSMPCAQP